MRRRIFWQFDARWKLTYPEENSSPTRKKHVIFDNYNFDLLSFSHQMNVKAQNR